jgi:cbb3-type cytochrome oxidase subunit 3
MRAIASGFFSQSPYLAGPLFTLVLFFVVFLFVVVYVMRSKKVRFDAVSSLPLSDDARPMSAEPPEGARSNEMTASGAG